MSPHIAATPGEADDVFTLFQPETRAAASFSAVPGCLQRTAIGQAVNHLNRIDIFPASYPHLDDAASCGDIGVDKVSAARAARKRRLTGLRRAPESQKRVCGE